MPCVTDDVNPESGDADVVAVHGPDVVGTVSTLTVGESAAVEGDATG